MRISDWSSDVCSSDLGLRPGGAKPQAGRDCPFGGGGAEAPLAIQTRSRRGDRTARPRPRTSAFRSGAAVRPRHPARKSVVSGKSVSVRVDLGGRRIITKKNTSNTDPFVYQKTS